MGFGVALQRELSRALATCIISPPDLPRPLISTLRHRHHEHSLTGASRTPLELQQRGFQDRRFDAARAHMPRRSAVTSTRNRLDEHLAGSPLAHKWHTCGPIRRPSPGLPERAQTAHHVSPEEHRRRKSTARATRAHDAIHVLGAVRPARRSAPSERLRRVKTRAGRASAVRNAMPTASGCRDHSGRSTALRDPRSTTPDQARCATHPFLRGVSEGERRDRTRRH